MGVTISYRGSISDLSRVEDFEDRVLDLALDLGGHAQVWRSVSDDDSGRVVRGVMLELFSGQETTSLLISPEGWLVGLCDIETAEKGQLADPPWCFVKTQYGPLEGHVAIVELLDALQKDFFPDLEVSDDANYWATRDLEKLRGSFQTVRQAIKGLAEGLRNHGLSSEAAEDPEIVAARVERIARQVHQTLARPPEHPPVRFAADDDLDESTPVDEAQWDAMFKENRRKQERIHRAIEERRGRGEEVEGALENALRDEGIIDLPGEPELSDVAREFEESLQEDDAPWKERLPSTEFDVEAEDEACDMEKELRERHPLRQKATDLLLQIFDISKEVEGERSNFIGILNRGALEISGGLAQALGTRDFEFDRGLNLTQFKRALRGAAFARGALFSLRCEGDIDGNVFEAIRGQLDELEAEIVARLDDLRQQKPAD